MSATNQAGEVARVIAEQLASETNVGRVSMPLTDWATVLAALATQTATSQEGEVPTREQAIRWLTKFSDADEVASTTPRKIAQELAGIAALLAATPTPPTLSEDLLEVAPMPECDSRQLWSDDEPDGYLESDRDWSERNTEVVAWLADNHSDIRAALAQVKAS